MPLQLAAIGIFIAVFAIATLRNAHLGIVMFGAACGVGLWLADMPLASETPPIADTAWSRYVGAVAAGLREKLADVHTLTTRGDGGLTSSVIVGDRGGLPVRTRIERIDGSVLALDVVIGRELDESRVATLALWAIPERRLGTNPPGPPSNPAFRSNDPQFDERFKTMPIFILSARSGEQDRRLALDMGADAFVTKPYDMAELVSRIRHKLETMGRSRAA